MKGKNAIAYVLYNVGCIHPYIISRILAIAELKYLKEKNRRLTDLEYSGIESAFYIENFNNIIEKDKCFKKIEGNPSQKKMGCIEYICQLPEIEQDVSYLDDAIDLIYDLNETEMNEIVIKDPNYKLLLKK
ncbi:MAG: hypothetical protein ACP5F1_05090 [Thermoplasmata archaeon]|nr:hypothetical protein [Thermoplasmata archaeon]